MNWAPLFLLIVSVSAGDENPTGDAPRRGPSYHRSLSAASEEASKDGQLILLVFSAAWCKPCQTLHKEVLESPDFQGSIGPLHIVEIDIDIDKKKAGEFQVKEIPDLLLLMGEGMIVARRSGFVSSKDLLAWIQEGRARAARGQWLGAAPGDRTLETFLRQAEKGSLDASGFQGLIEAVGNPDPAVRARASTVLLAQRDKAMPYLIDGAAADYLGVRIAASDLLEKLAPDAPDVDPWSAPAARQESASMLRKWWEETQELPASLAPVSVDPGQERALEHALEDLISGDPVRCTDALAALTRIGQPALPRIREAIRQFERKDNRKALSALEEARWSILIPDRLSERLPGVRRDLARGTGPQRQAASEMLAAGDREALPALAELLLDSDNLVREAALHALSAIGEDQALFAMSALLVSPESNLRMTAAQDLGRTKRKEAAQYLITVLDDADEVVVCTALAALEEIKAVESRDELLRCLKDPRWRVRAAAAEVIGKLKIWKSEEALSALLKDADSFVVKSALEALRQLRHTPPYEEIRALMKRVPAIQPLAIAMILSSDSPYPLQMGMELFGQLEIGGQMAILDVLKGFRNENNSDDDFWKPLLVKAFASLNGEIRRKAASLLPLRSTRLATQFVAPLLGDDDAQVRASAADAVLGIAAHHWGVSDFNQGSDYGLLKILAGSSPIGESPEGSKPAEDQDGGGVAPSGGGGDGHGWPAPEQPPQEEAPGSAKNREQIARASELLKQHHEWHRLLLERNANSLDPRLVLAIYVTGDGKLDLDALVRLVDQGNEEADLEFHSEAKAVRLLLKRLPWPEGKAFLEIACQKPFVLCKLLGQFHYASKEVQDSMFDPGRLVPALEQARGASLSKLLENLLSDPGQSPASILSRGERNRTIIDRLIHSAQPAMRAVAAYALGSMGDAGSEPWIENALKEENPWVRRAALQSIIRQLKPRKVLEEKLAPSLRDPDSGVVSIAALGLLDLDVLARAGMTGQAMVFKFEDIALWNTTQWGQGYNDRPLVSVEGPPELMQQARQHLAVAHKSGNTELVSIFALLLAQYRDNTGLDLLVENPNEETSRNGSALLVTGIALSKNPKYIPALRNLLNLAQEEWTAAQVFQGLRGMPGPEARELRREVNQRLREFKGR